MGSSCAIQRAGRSRSSRPDRAREQSSCVPGGVRGGVPRQPPRDAGAAQHRKAEALHARSPLARLALVGGVPARRSGLRRRGRRDRLHGLGAAGPRLDDGLLPSGGSPAAAAPSVSTPIAPAPTPARSAGRLDHGTRSIPNTSLQIPANNSSISFRGATYSLPTSARLPSGAGSRPRSPSPGTGASRAARPPPPPRARPRRCASPRLARRRASPACASDRGG